MANLFVEQLKTVKMDAESQKNQILSNRHHREFLAYLKQIDYKYTGPYSLEEALDIFVSLESETKPIEALTDNELTVAVFLFYESILFMQMRIEQLTNHSKDILLLTKDELLVEREKYDSVSKLRNTLLGKFQHNNEKLSTSLIAGCFFQP